MQPDEVVIRLRLTAPRIKKLHEEYLEMTNKRSISKSFWDEIFHIVCSNALRKETDFLLNLRNLSDNAEKMAEKLGAFSYMCDVCGEPVFASPEKEWKSLLDENGHFGNWGHTKCHKRAGRA